MTNIRSQDAPSKSTKVRASTWVALTILTILASVIYFMSSASGYLASSVAGDLIKDRLKSPSSYNELVSDVV